MDKSASGELVPRFLGFPDNRDFFYVMRRHWQGGQAMRMSRVLLLGSLALLGACLLGQYPPLREQNEVLFRQLQTRPRIVGCADERHPEDIRQVRLHGPGESGDHPASGHAGRVLRPS